MRLLVVHGGLIWRLALIVLTLLSTAIAARGRWWRAPAIAALFAAGWFAVIYAAGRIVLPAYAAPYDHFSKRLIAATAFQGAREEAIERMRHAPTTRDEKGIAIEVERMNARGVCPDRWLAEIGRIEQASAQPCGSSGYAVQLGEIVQREKPRPQAAPRQDDGTLYSPHIWTAEQPTPFERLARDALLGKVTVVDPTTRGKIEIAIRTGASLDDTADAAPLGIAKLAHRHAPDEIDIASSCPLREALRAALAGDGGPLAACKIAWDDVLLVETVLPHVRTHRAELAIALRMLRDPHAYEETSPYMLIDTYAHYRDLSRLAGDLVETARWQARVERFAALLEQAPIAAR